MMRNHSAEEDIIVRKNSRQQCEPSRKVNLQLSPRELGYYVTPGSVPKQKQISTAPKPYLRWNVSTLEKGVDKNTLGTIGKG